jgi:hypothetical protein
MRLSKNTGTQRIFRTVIAEEGIEIASSLRVGLHGSFCFEPSLLADLGHIEAGRYPGNYGLTSMS